MTPLMQSILVYRAAGAVVCRGAIDGAERAFSTAHAALQHAIDAAHRHVDREGDPHLGGQVQLQPGRYELESTLRLLSGVSLLGAGPSTRLIAPAQDDAIALEATAGDRVVVRDLAVAPRRVGQGFAGIVLDGTGASRVIDVRAQGFGGHGVVLRNNCFLNEVRGCEFAGNQTSGLLLHTLERHSRVGEFVPNLVANCISVGGGHGFQLSRAIVVNLVGCQAYQSRQCGFLIEKVSNSVCLSGCRTFQIERDAVHVHDSHEFNATGNIFCWHRGRGIVLHDVAWGCVSGNEVIDSGSEMTGGDAAIGILLSGGTRGVSVTGNTVFNWGGQGLLTIGIREEPTCANNTIIGNNLNWWQSADVQARGAGTIVQANCGQQAPAYKGSPDGPDERFRPERVADYIQRQFGTESP